MKKLFTLILAVVLCFSIAACTNPGNTDATETTSATDPNPSLDSQPTASAPLNVWAIESYAITDYATNGQSLWMEEQTGVPVNWMAVPSNGWYTAFQASVMAEEPVDIYLYPFDTTEVDLLGTQMNYIIPLENLITEENTPNIWAILEANPELRDLITAPDGHIYTLFANDVYNLHAYTQKLWVNRHFLEMYTADTGKEMPSTTAAFEEMLLYFNTHDMNGNGIQDEIPYIGQAGVDGMYNLFGSFLPANSSSGFGCYINDRGELDFAYNQDAYKEALAYIQNLYTQGLISPDTFTTTPEERYVLTSGNPEQVRACVVAAVTANQVVQLSSEAGSMTYDDYIALPPLAGPDGVRTIMSTGEAGVSLRNAITTRCQDPIAAIKWLDAGYCEAARLYAVYGGLENEAWTYADGETLAGPGRVITSQLDSEDNVCWRGQGIVFRITEQDYLSMDASQIATNSDLASYRANLAYRPYMVQNPWPSIVWAGEHAEEGAQFSELNGLIQKAVTEFYTDVVLGRKNLESDWDFYVQSLNDMNLKRYIELVDLYISKG